MSDSRADAWQVHLRGEGPDRRIALIDIIPSLEFIRGLLGGAHSEQRMLRTSSVWKADHWRADLDCYRGVLKGNTSSPCMTVGCSVRQDRGCHTVGDRPIW